MSVKWSWCSNLNRCRGIFFYRTLCMLHDEEKMSIQWPCSSDFHRFARDFFSFFVIFIKILFHNWRRLRHPSVIFVPVKGPREGGIWSPEWTLVWGIWMAFWPGYGGIWTIIFKKVKCPGGWCWSDKNSDCRAKAKKVVLVHSGSVGAQCTSWPLSIVRVSESDVTQDDSPQWFLAQHSTATLLQHCFESLQHCSNIATMCCAKNRCCESSLVTSPWDCLDFFFLFLMAEQLW